MGEPIESALAEHGVIEQRAPLLDRAVAGEDRRASAVPLQDEFVEVARLLGVEAAQPEVVDDQDVGGEQTPANLLGGVVGTRLVEQLEQLIGPQEEHGLAHTAGRVSDRRGEEGLADTHRADEDHILLALDEAQAEQVLHTIAIEGDRCVPVERLQGLLLFEARAPEPQGEALVIASIDLVLQDQFEEVELTELRLLRVADPVGKRDQQAR